MKQYVMIVTIVLGAGVLTTQFTNCDVYSQNGLFQSLGSQCSNSDCNNDNVQMLDLKVNGPEPFLVDNFTEKFNIGGDCNEGGFPDSIIQWTLKRDGSLLMTSEARYGTTGDERFRARCKDGRFSLQIDLVDNNDVWRTGLKSSTTASGTQAKHTVEIDLYGINASGEKVKSSVVVPTVVSLIPICFQNNSCN